MMIVILVILIVKLTTIKHDKLGARPHVVIKSRSASSLDLGSTASSDGHLIMHQKPNGKLHSIYLV